MNALGINGGLLFIQVVFASILIGFPIFSLIDLGKKKLGSIVLAIWVLIICAIPVLGGLAYWIIRPTAENKI